MNSEQDETKAFFESWRIYRDVVDGNYMAHREVIDSIAGEMHSHRDKPLDILELGCGDAYVVSELLAHYRVNHYTGIDLSSMALEFAAQQLQARVGELTLHCDDMVARVALLSSNSNAPRYDFIFAGYTLHHLPEESTASLLKQCQGLLKPGGKFIIYDLVHNEDENRDSFIDPSVAHVINEWRQLSEDQLSQIGTHIRNHDYPISLDRWQQMAQQANFNECQHLFRDKSDLFSVMRLSA